MLELKDVTIDDRDLFQKYFFMKQYGNSEFSFTNVFIWRNAYSVKYSLVNDFLCIFAKYNQLPPYIMMPIGEGNLGAVFEKLIQYFASNKNKLIIRSVTEEGKSEIERHFPGKFIFKDQRDYYDYVYLSSDLINLQGKKFHAKRNHINKFVSQNKYVYESLTSERVDECVASALDWCKKRNCKESQELEHEKHAILEALGNFEKLKFKGGIIKVEGKVKAFSLGDLLTEDMAVIHIEKADPDIQGSYAIINQQFCEHEWKDIKYINREEDIGIPGLRKAKLSYNPEKFIKKYCATLNH